MSLTAISVGYPLLSKTMKICRRAFAAWDVSVAARLLFLDVHALGIFAGAVVVTTGH